MSQNSKIEWTDQTWNPVTGCTKISAGCKHCYAETMHRRLRAMGQEKYRHPFLQQVTCHAKALAEPFSWNTPRLVFVNSMSDLFHEKVPLGFIKKVFSVMQRTPQHTYQVLTKRSQRLLEAAPHLPWPPNVWMGVTVEHNATLYRAEHLLQTPARVKFLSCEPLLGPVTLGHYLFAPKAFKAVPQRSHATVFDAIHWVIAGGESGPKARPMNPAWARSLRDECAAANVPFFFKQWGGWSPGFPPGAKNITVFKYVNGVLSETLYKTGKKKGGNVLDGKTHLAMPVPIKIN